MKFSTWLTTGFLFFTLIHPGCTQPPRPSDESAGTGAEQTADSESAEPRPDGGMLFPMHVVEGEWNIFGYIDSLGNIIIEPQYWAAIPFSEGLSAFAVGDENESHWGFINPEGEIVVEPQYFSAGDFKEGRAMVSIQQEDSADPLCGFIDTEGNVVVDFEWHEVHDFSNERAFVRRDDYAAFIDLYGVEIIPDAMGYFDFMDGLAALHKEGETDYIDVNGNIVLTTHYEMSRFFSEGLSPVQFEGKSGYIDKEGNVAIPLEFDEVTDFSDGSAFVMEGQVWKCIDPNGQTLFETDLLPAGPFSEGLVPMREVSGDLTGFVNIQGELVIEPQFTAVEGFRYGLCRVRFEGGYGYIDKVGTMVFEYRDDTGII